MKFCGYRCALLLRCLCTAWVLIVIGMTTSVVAAGEKNPAADIEQPADRMIAGMSLEEKVGQMMILGLHGPALDAESKALLDEIRPAGIILYDANMETQDQVQKLNQELQAKYGQKIPLFISVDQEGGFVSRMQDQLTPPPSQEAIGRTGQPENARKSAVETAKRLRSLGFNVNFAPVADVGSGRERSFSKDAKVAAAFVEQAAAGYEQEHMIYALKHFPGIGRGHKNSHLDSVVVAADKKTLLTEDVLPFQRVMAKYPPEDYFIMVSHISYPALDKEYPASLSAVIVTDLLRRQFGWQGVIITDAMEMGALSKHYSFHDTGVKAVQAGEDILMVAHGYDHAREVYHGVLQALRDGIISQERIDASLKRILRVKLQHLYPVGREPLPEKHRN